MFNKPAKPVATRPDVAEAAARKSLPCSLIAQNVHRRGDIESEGDVQMDGELHGDLRVGHLSLGETGLVEGSIIAESVEIRGRVSGAIRAGSVHLHATAHVDGDIAHRELAIDAGAHFAGRSEHLGQPASNQLSLPIAAE